MKGRIGERTAAEEDLIGVRAQRFGTVDADTVFVDETILQRKKKRLNIGISKSDLDVETVDAEWVSTSLPEELVLTGFSASGPVPAASRT